MLESSDQMRKFSTQTWSLNVVKHVCEADKAFNRDISHLTVSFKV